jgi:hypothetical protein
LNSDLIDSVAFEMPSFATLPNDPHTVAIKMTPANLDALVASDRTAFRNVWGGRWVGVNLSRVTERTLRELLHDAWELTAPATLVTGGHAKAKRSVQRTGAARKRPKRG